MDTLQFLLSIGNDLFGKRTAIIGLWQEIAENFYPERAFFTAPKCVGDNFADNLMTSYPVLARRDLGNAFGTMLRQSGKEWFSVRTDREDKEDTDSKEWLEWVCNVQRRAIYDKRSQFTRATKEGDHDFAAFGQAVLSVQLNKQRNGLLFRCYHLGDVAWVEDEDGKICMVFRKSKLTARDLVRMFGKERIHSDVQKALEKTPLQEFNVWHVVTPTDMLTGDDAKLAKYPYASFFIDIDHEHIMEKTGSMSKIYVIPRWQTVSGSQYAYSPATIIALPDARLIQDMTRVLLEAGEKAVNPPMIAVQEAIRSDVSIFAGGLTWVDPDYDERLGEVLRPLTSDKSGLPVGLEMQQDVRAMITEAFYLNKLQLPQNSNEMTAYEVGQRVQEYIRQAMPIFEPMEEDYNGQLCEETFGLLLRNGAFGSPRSIPKMLQDADIQFVFESPLRDATERQKGQRFLEAKSMLADAVAIDQSAVHMIDVKKSLRDVLHGIKVPAAWIRTESEVENATRQLEQAQQSAAMLENMSKGAEVAKTLSEVQPVPGAV